MRILCTQPHKAYKIGKTTNNSKFDIIFNNNLIFSEEKTILAQQWELNSFNMEKEQSTLDCALSEYESIKDRCKYEYKINNDMYDKIDEIFIENIKQYNVGIVRTNGTNGEYELANAFSNAGFTVYDIHMNDIIETR